METSKAFLGSGARGQVTLGFTAIDLLPNTTPPRGRTYPLSLHETQAMKIYVQENLEKGFIHTFTFPVGVGVFLIEKKDGSLRPYID